MINASIQDLANVIIKNETKAKNTVSRMFKA